MNIRWKNIDRSVETEAHITKRLDKIARFEGPKLESSHIDIEYYKNDNSYSVTMVIPVEGHPSVTASAKGRNLITCCNEAVEKVLDQMRRIKTKSSRK